ncbi:hydroxymethylbilane synthase [Roseomonas sp. CCTCC AB2023176]|uniref:hydroxymethylbilane synthase n=1 Tax=Roseomonas sp. CCTCC AB2023176 TaxID=3342640 RepID=UPI0035E2F4D7
MTTLDELIRFAVADEPALLDLPDDGRMVPPHARALPLRVGTRGSPLALWQARHFMSCVSRFCAGVRTHDAFHECVIATTGDRVLDRPLAEIGGKGLFAKEIHEALLDGRIDFAVHSLKDLETEMPPGIVLACVLEREDNRDALILGQVRDAIGNDAADPWACLPHGALVGTASVRRGAQLLAARPDLRVEPIRGNVQTRLMRLAEGRYDATLLALAGLKRLGMEAAADVVIETHAMLPAACQGIVGITCREDDADLRQLLAAVEHHESRIAADAERALLGTLDGTCHTPIGAHARRLPDGRLHMEGMIARADGSFLLRRSITGAPSEAAELGRELGESLWRDAPADVLG